MAKHKPSKKDIGPSAGRYAGQHIAVTGAGSGIGRAIALRLAAEGATLSLFGRRKSALLETAKLIGAAGGARVQTATLDVRERSAVERAFKRAAVQQGALFALVHSAGLGGPNADGSDDCFDELIDTNLRGSYHCARAAVRRMQPGPKTRHIVLIASILGRIGVAGYSGYCASKAGVLGLTRALAMELAPLTVQVNALCPGWVNTDMATQGLAGMAQALKIELEAAHRMAMSAVPLGRMGEPEEVAGLVAYLLSDDARGTTGAGIDINGGAFMH